MNFKKTNYILFSLLAVASIFSSCKKEGCTDPTASNYSEEAKKDDGSCEYPTEYGSVSLMFDHRWGGSQAPFTMNTELTHPGTNELITMTTLNYYISNIKLQQADGTWWSEEESYHLIKVGENTTPSITISNVPAGRYTNIQYMIGVDSLRNVSGAQTGALSPANSMFWNWNTGYIFVKAEGSSDAAPNGIFKYHLGGFTDADNKNAIRINSHSFNAEELEITKTKNPQFNFIVNAARFWHGGLSLSDVNMIMMPGQNAVDIATNFGDGFILSEITNE